MKEYKMNIDDLTLGQLKEITKMMGATNDASRETLNSHLGEKVIVRTCSAGVWFGKLVEKAGTEVILENARRMYYWKSKKSISLSGVAVHGIHESSKICPSIEKQWLDAIEIISCTDDAIKSIESQKDAEAS